MILKNYTKEFAYNFKLAYPVILGMIGHALIGIVDSIMVGNLGSTELAAVSLANSFIFIGMSIGIGFSTAITPLIAEADAVHDESSIRSFFHHGLLSCTVLGFLIFAAIVAVKPVMTLMGQQQAVVDLASPYIDWVAFSLVPVIIFQGYKQFADGLSKTKYAMYAIYMANVVHVFFNYVLIYGVWGFPKMGLMGAALGTLISRIMMVVFMHSMLSKDIFLRKYLTGFIVSDIKKSLFNKLISLGIPSAMQMLFEVALFTAAVWLSGTLSKNSQAANQIALTLASSTFMVVVGFSVAAMIRVSNFKGKNDFKGLVVVARSIFLLTFFIEVFFAFLLIITHNYLPQLFLNMSDVSQQIDNDEVVLISSKLLLIAAVFQISDGIQAVVLGALRGLQDVRVPMYITFFSYWIIGYPISYYLGKHTSMGATGIWLGLLIALTAAAILLYSRFVVLIKKRDFINQVYQSPKYK